MKKKTDSLTNPTITTIELSMDTNLPLGGMEFRQGTKNNRQLYHLSEYYNDIIIDGVSIGVVDTYTFTVGSHIIEYIMKDNTKIFENQFRDLNYIEKLKEILASMKFWSRFFEECYISINLLKNFY